MQIKKRVRWFELIFKVIAIILVVVDVSILLIGDRLSRNFDLGSSNFTNDPTVSYKLKGSNEMRLPLGAEYNEPGFEIINSNGEISVTQEGNVDTSKEGEYVINYNFCDENDYCTTVERSIKVIKPSGTIYLTFDDGPSPHTERLLDVLKKYHVLATFFVTGSGSDETLKREYTEGHAIGLHSYSHQYSYIYQNTTNFWDDMNKVQERVKSITGEETHLMRFPGGSSNTISARYDNHSHIMSQLVKEAEERGFTYFDWNVLSGDAGETTDTEKIIENVTFALKQDDISIVLQHDVKDYSVNAVERIIEFGIEHNYFFDKLDAGSFAAHHGVNN